MLHYLYVPHEILLKLIRALFRVYYFAHGKMTSYSYLAQSMVFYNQTESKSICQGVVLLCPADNPNDKWLEHPRLFSTSISMAYMNAINHVCHVTRTLRTNDPTLFVTVCFASWAYRGFFDTTEEAIETAMSEYNTPDLVGARTADHLDK